ncbi:MAG: ribose 5-phosphate isomerase B [Planctomycetota bacterium]
MNLETIWIGNDHGGYQLKLAIAEHLRQKGCDLYDVGSDSTEIVRYPYYAAKVAGTVSSGKAKRGILICSTGIGMSIIANKYKGVRAALCTSVHMGHMTRAHNDSNILCLGGTITRDTDAIKIVDEWLSTEYEGGRHDISLGLIAQAEDAMCNPKGWTPTEHPE